MDTLLVVGQLQLSGGDLAKSLEGTGFSLFESCDSDDAVAICRRVRPALVFVEVDSPDGDYFDLLPRLRCASSNSGRIVAICNRYSDGLDDYCEELGANLTLPKVDVRTDFKLFLRGLMTLIPANHIDPPERPPRERVDTPKPAGLGCTRLGPVRV